MGPQLVHSTPFEDRGTKLRPGEVTAQALVTLRDAPPTLTSVEWQVVAAAFSDASTGSCGQAGPPSRLTLAFRRLLVALTGVQTSPPLADPRLETLRFFLCFTRDHGRPPRQGWEELLLLGFSERQVEALAILALDGVTARR